MTSLLNSLKLFITISVFACQHAVLALHSECIQIILPLRMALTTDWNFVGK